MDDRCDLSSACALQECLCLAPLHQLRHDALWRHLHMTSEWSTNSSPTFAYNVFPVIRSVKLWYLLAYTMSVEKPHDFITWFIKRVS